MNKAGRRRRLHSGAFQARDHGWLPGSADGSDSEARTYRSGTDGHEHCGRSWVKLLEDAHDKGAENGADSTDTQLHAQSGGAHVRLICASGEIVQHKLSADGEEPCRGGEYEVRCVAIEEDKCPDTGSPNHHQRTNIPRLDWRRSARAPQTIPPINDMICMRAPKPKLAANVSPRCIMTVGIHPERPNIQNKLKNDAAHTASVVRR